MVEDVIPNPEAKELPKVFGLVLFVTNEYGEALLFVNNDTKRLTQKVSGQLTIPAETIEPGEDLQRDTLPRTIAEEVGVISGATAKSCGIVRLDTPHSSIIAIGVEVRTTTDAIQIKPKDSKEVSQPTWVPLDMLDNRTTMRIGSWDVPLYRAFIPPLAANILNSREGMHPPLYQRIKSELPEELYQYLEKNPGSIHPVE